MFDSDALYPGEKDESTDELTRLCMDVGVAFHCLERRAIENYLCRRALNAWAAHEPRQQRAYGARVEAFYGPFMSANPARRHHFNMKGGFQKDQNRAPGARDLYEGIPDRDKAALHGGFGNDIRAWLKRDLINEADLRDDGSWVEIEAFTRDLIALLR